MHSQTVTPRKLEILRFVRDFRNQNGYSPTMQEIGEHLGLTKVTVFEHVGGLEKLGLLLRGAKHSARSLRVSPDVKFDDERPTRLPLLGRIAAGSPIEAIENREYLDLEELFATSDQRDTFVLRVAGDSMIEDHIQEGDFVVCQRNRQPRNGDTVVALLETGEATLKHFFREKGKVRLQPANSAYKPIYLDQVDVQGIMIGVVRRA